MGNRQTIISVIMPVYNAAKFLPRSLKALTSSTYPAHDIIVVDDCSTDDSVEIANQNGAKVLHHPVNPGLQQRVTLVLRKLKEKYSFLLMQTWWSIKGQSNV